MTPTTPSSLPHMHQIINTRQVGRFHRVSGVNSFSHVSQLTPTSNLIYYSIIPTGIANMPTVPGDFESAEVVIVREIRVAVRLQPHSHDYNANEMQPGHLSGMLRSPVHAIVFTVATGATTVLLVIIIVWLAVLHAYTLALQFGLETLRIAYSAPPDSLRYFEDAGTQTYASVPASSVTAPDSPVIAPKVPSESAQQADDSHPAEPFEQLEPSLVDTMASAGDVTTEPAVAMGAFDGEQSLLRNNTLRQIQKHIKQPQRPTPPPQLTDKGFNAADLEAARAFAQSATRSGQKPTRNGNKAPTNQNNAPMPKQSARLPPQGPKAWVAQPKALPKITAPTEPSAPRAKATIRKATGRLRFTDPAPTESYVAAESTKSQPQDTQPTSAEQSNQKLLPGSDIKAGTITIAKLKDISPKKNGPGVQCQICLRWSNRTGKLHDNDAIDVCCACHAVVNRIQNAKRVINEPDFYMPETSRFAGGSLLANRQQAASGPSPSKTESTYTSKGDIIICHIPNTPPGFAGINSAQRTPVNAKSTGKTRTDATISPLTSQEQLVDLDDDLGNTNLVTQTNDPKTRSDSQAHLLDLEDDPMLDQEASRSAKRQSPPSSKLRVASAVFAPSRSDSGRSSVSPLNLPAPLREYESRVSQLPDPFVPRQSSVLAMAPPTHLTAPEPKPPVLYNQQTPYYKDWQPSGAPGPGYAGTNTLVYDFAAPTTQNASPSTSIAEAYYRNTPESGRTIGPQCWNHVQGAAVSPPWNPDCSPTHNYENIPPPPGLPLPEHLQPARRSISHSGAVPIVDPAQADKPSSVNLRRAPRSTSLSKEIPIVKPQEALATGKDPHGKQLTLNSSCDVAAVRTSDPDSVPVSSERQQQQQCSTIEPEPTEPFPNPLDESRTDRRTEVAPTHPVPAESSEPQEENQGECRQITACEVNDYKPIGTRVKSNNIAKTLRLERKAARDALNDAWHVRELLREGLVSGWTLPTAEKLVEATKSYNEKRQDLASLMVSGELNDEDAEMYPRFSTKDTAKPKVSETSQCLYDWLN